MKYRHEWKHEISYGDMLVLRQRLSVVMKRDVHAIDGTYLIRSLYFDNASDKALREKVDGVNIREKFRIRYYNNDTSLIHLEKKSKVNGLCLKDSVALTKEQAQAIAKAISAVRCKDPTKTLDQAITDKCNRKDKTLCLHPLGL